MTGNSLEHTIPVFLAEMAKDPQIQKEIKKIDKEFSVAEGDGII